MKDIVQGILSFGSPTYNNYMINLFYKNGT